MKVPSSFFTNPQISAMSTAPIGNPEIHFGKAPPNNTDIFVRQKLDQLSALKKRQKTARVRQEKAQRMSDRTYQERIFRESGSSIVYDRSKFQHIPTSELAEIQTNADTIAEKGKEQEAKAIRRLRTPTMRLAQKVEDLRTQERSLPKESPARTKTRKQRKFRERQLKAHCDLKGMIKNPQNGWFLSSEEIEKIQSLIRQGGHPFFRAPGRPALSISERVIGDLYSQKSPIEFLNPVLKRIGRVKNNRYDQDKERFLSRACEALRTVSRPENSKGFKALLFGPELKDTKLRPEVAESILYMPDDIIRELGNDSRVQELLPHMVIPKDKLDTHISEGFSNGIEALIQGPEFKYSDSELKKYSDTAQAYGNDNAFQILQRELASRQTKTLNVTLNPKQCN